MATADIFVLRCIRWPLSSIGLRSEGDGDGGVIVMETFDRSSMESLAPMADKSWLARVDRCNADSNN